MSARRRYVQLERRSQEVATLKPHAEAAHAAYLMLRGDVSQAAVARALHMSLRTLQRRLRGEDLTFRDVVDSARRQLARTYAKDRSMTGEEIAYLLGFSEPRSLSRAMARWNARPDPLR